MYIWCKICMHYEESNERMAGGGDTEMEIYNGYPALTKYQLLTTNGENKIVIKVPLSLKKQKQTCK